MKSPFGPLIQIDKRGIRLRPDDAPPPDMFACAPVADFIETEAVVGSVQRTCADCNCLVWQAPDGQMLAVRWPRVPILCLNCALKRVESAGP